MSLLLKVDQYVANHIYRYVFEECLKQLRPTKINKFDGAFWWEKDGNLHRIGGPAIIYNSGTREWWFEGHLHREGDRPARIESDGARSWWIKSKLHREGVGTAGAQPALILP